MADNTYYELPPLSPVDPVFETVTIEISAGLFNYLPLITSAIEAELENPAVWSDEERETALGYMEDLKSHLIDVLTQEG